MEKEILLLEYEKLKDEQLHRIGYRDNMIYLNLFILGSIVSFALSSSNNYNAFLVIPWCTFILGWMYLVNDEKVSQIGRYIRINLTEKIKNEFNIKSEILQWEIVHRSDKRRKMRKIAQLVVDLITFPCSGIFAIVLYCNLVCPNSLLLFSFIIIEILLLIYLAVKILIYADFKMGI